MDAEVRPNSRSPAARSKSRKQSTPTTKDAPTPTFTGTDVIHVSGLRKDGAVPDDVTEEVALAWANGSAALEAADFT
jgi:hypothetical protein